MARAYASMTTLITQKLQSAGTMDFTVAEVDSGITEALKEFANYQSHIVPVVLQVESRHGTASASTTDSLADTVKNQFIQDDDANEKVIKNTTDKTWAVVLSVAGTTANTGVVGISKDIFTVGENYRIYNRRCWNEKQLYIGGMPDYVEIDSVEYPIGQQRNFKILNDVLELDVDGVADSNANTSLATLPDVDVLIRFNRPHILTTLPTYTGYLAATCDAAITTFAGSALPTGTISIGDEFYMENLRNLYTVTTGTTAAAGTGTFSFYPPLETNIASTAASTIRFTKSTLSSQQEDIFADLCAARLAINKAPKLYAQANSALANISAATVAIYNMSVQLLAGTSYAAAATINIGAASSMAATAFGYMPAMSTYVAAATTAAASALALINTIPVVLDAENDYMQQATTQINNAIAVMREVTASQGQSDTYLKIANITFKTGEEYIKNAVACANQASMELNTLASKIRISNAGKNYESWGYTKLNETLARLRRDTKIKVSRRYSTE
jgi:hypothetical protein